MNRTIDAGPAVHAFGGLVLIVSLFLSWYGDASAFDVFESVDIVLLAAGLVAAWVGVARPEDDRIGLGVAAAALLVVVVSLVDAPPAAGPASLSAGAWIGLVATVVMLAGAASSAASFSVTVDVRGRDRRRRVAAVDRRAPAEKVVPPEEDASSYAARRRSILSDDDEQDTQRTQAMPAVDPGDG